jgi:hypothetical protein
MYSTSATTPGTTMDNTEILKAMVKMMEENRLLPKPDKWILITPQGIIYEGTVAQLAPVLMAEHPLVKRPSLVPFVAIDGP